MKKNNIYITIYIVAITIMTTMFTACNNFLDLQPKGELIPETLADYEALLNYPQMAKGSEVYPNFMTDDVFLPDEGGDKTPGLNTSDKLTNNLYSFNKETSGPSADDDLWKYSYARIYYDNVIIDNAMNATKASQQEKKQLRAEALLCRAFEYLNLVNAYAKIYDEKTAHIDPAVPLVLKADLAMKNLKRATVKEVYEQIEKDLKEAETYLPQKPKLNAFRASKPAALGLLARMYLYMAKYQDALKYAEMALNINNKLLNLTKYKVTNPFFAIGRLDVPDAADNPENIFIRLAPYVYGLSSVTYASDELAELYGKNDMRLQLYFVKNLYGVIPLEHYLWNPWLKANLAIATPEIYLIAAECYARGGNAQKAMERVNLLYKNRVKNYKPLMALSAKEALSIVLTERRRELAMTGMNRFIDLKRLNKEQQFAKNVTHIVKGQKLTLKPNDDKYLLPIPPKVLRFNTDMRDNKR